MYVLQYTSEFYISLYKQLCMYSCFLLGTSINCSNTALSYLPRQIPVGMMIANRNTARITTITHDASGLEP